MAPRLTQSERSMLAQIRAEKSWANTSDRSARTAPARKAALDRFERDVDPDGTLPPAERAQRAEHARRAYFKTLAYKSARARRQAKELNEVADDAERELAQAGHVDLALPESYDCHVGGDA